MIGCGPGGVSLGSSRWRSDVGGLSSSPTPSRAVQRLQAARSSLRALQRRATGIPDVMARKLVHAASGESPLSGQPARPGQTLGSSPRIHPCHLDVGLRPQAWEDVPVARSFNVDLSRLELQGTAMRDCCGTSPGNDHYRSSSYIYVFTTTTLPVTCR